MMWMIGYNDAGEFNSIQDPLSGRKLRPLIPRPATTAAAASPPCLTRIHGTDLLALNHHLAMAEQNKREINAQQVVVSSRWNPTPEQLQTLEELYRRGTRTPSAEQIQHITSQLRRYGKIEGKNVFYWFQNHKARERQKRRRQLESLSDEKNNNNNNFVENGEKREPPGANKTVFEDEQTTNWESPANSSIIAEKNGAKKTECKLPDGWIQFDDDAESQQRKTATWQMVHNLSCSSSSSPPTNPVNSFSAPTANSTIISSTTLTTMETKPQDFINILLGPHTNGQNFGHFAAARGGGDGEEAQTLQLFPLRSGGRHCLNYEYIGDEAEEEEEETGAAMNHVTYPFQFIEFLPLKN